MCHLFVFMGCYFPRGPLKVKDKLAVDALISFREIISEVDLCSPKCTADGLSYEHQNAFLFYGMFTGLEGFERL